MICYALIFHNVVVFTKFVKGRGIVYLFVDSTNKRVCLRLLAYK